MPQTLSPSKRQVCDIPFPEESPKQSNSLKLHLVLVFCAAFGIIWFFYVGLPFDFSADIAGDLKVIRGTSYSQLFSYFINPLTPGGFFYGRMEELRPIIYFVHKVFLDLYGLTLEPSHYTIAFSHGLLATTFFLITYGIAGRLWLSWLLVILYASFPTNPVMLAGYTSLEIHFLQSTLTILSLGALAYATWSNKLSASLRGMLLLVWLSFIWIEINWHSSAKLLPFVSLAFLALRLYPIWNRIGRFWTFAFVLTNLFMFLMVIPLSANLIPGNVPQNPPIVESLSPEQKLIDEHFKEKQQRLMRFKFSNVLARTFVVPGEENPFLVVNLDKPPMSFTSDLGLFLGWFFWLGLLTSPFLWWRIRKKYTRNSSEQENFDFLTHAGLLLGIWFSAVLASFGAGQHLSEVRHINFALVPGILMLAFKIRLIQENMSEFSRIRKIGGWLLGGALCFTLVQNFGFITKWIHHFGGIQHANYESNLLIYRQMNHREPQGTELHEQIRDLERRFVITNWFDLKGHWFEDAKEQLKQEGQLILRMRTEGTQPDQGKDYETLQKFQQEGFLIEKIATLPFLDAKPAFFAFQRWLSEYGWKRGKDWRIVVYRIDVIQ